MAQAANPIMQSLSLSVCTPGSEIAAVDVILASEGGLHSSPSHTPTLAHTLTLFLLHTQFLYLSLSLSLTLSLSQAGS